MRVMGALDLLSGEVVQLVQGDPERRRLTEADPDRLVRLWRADGMRELHIVDLDAALARGDNRRALRRLIERSDMRVQVGGGIRDVDSIAAWLDAGAWRVICGTRALEDPDWLANAAQRFPDRIVVAVDVRDGRPTLDGWRRCLRRSPSALLDSYARLPLAAILVTDVNREGRLAGVDIELFRGLRAATSHRLIAAGSIRSLDDLRGLDAAAIDEVVVGTALYTGDLTTSQLRQEYWK